jgi:hypothetical protein
MTVSGSENAGSGEAVIAAAPGRRVMRRSALGALLPPVVVFVAAQLFLMVAIRNYGFEPNAAGTWSRGDSGHYVSIAQKGYELFLSDGKPPFEDYPVGLWMGNCGWMPLYSILMRGVMIFGVEAVVAGVFLSGLFHLATLGLLWNRFLVDIGGGKAFCCLLIAAFWPSMVYQHAVFPISLVVFLSLLCMDQMLAGHWWLAGLSGMLASTAYGTGFLIGPAACLFLLLPPYGGARWKTIVGRAAIVGGLTMLGLGLVLGAHQVLVGKWNAFFLTQAKYGHGIHNPASILYQQIEISMNADPTKSRVWLQITVVAMATIFACAWAAWKWNKRSAMDRLLAVFAAVFWIFPLVMGLGVAPLRPAACMMPMAAMARKLPIPAQLLLLGVCGILAVQVLWPFLTIMAL